MTSNHGEYRSDITLENLKCSVKIYSGFTYLYRKKMEELEVIKLAFSNFL